MAFILTPRFAPVYQQQCSSPWSCAPARPQYSYRRVVRPAVPSFVPFLSQVDELLSALDQEAQREAQREALREAHRQRQQRKRIFRAHFNVHENQEGYQVDGELPGFEQSNIQIEVTDAHTLRVAGNTEKKSEEQPQPEATAEPRAIEPQTTESTETAQDDTIEGVTLNEQESHSDTESHKSYQATVEDDFEDLGAETSSTISSGSNTPSEPKEPKGKEKAVDDSTETAVQPQPQPETEEYQFHGSFERTFRFPERIDASTVKASLKNGLLSITVPKAKAPEVRRILIQ
jgi:HSP20 family molecular chaperone IbpA